MLVVTYRISRASPRCDLFYNFAAFVVSGNTLVYPRDVQHGTKWAVFFETLLRRAAIRAGINETTALSISSRRAAGSDAKSSTLNVSAAVPAHVASEVADHILNAKAPSHPFKDLVGTIRFSQEIIATGSNHPRTLRSKHRRGHFDNFQFRAQLD